MDEFDKAVDALRHRAPDAGTPPKPLPPPARTVEKGLLYWREVPKPDPNAKGGAR